jgi:hypothetical protein
LPKIKTREDCIKFAVKLHTLDCFFVEGQDFVAKLVQFGTGDGKGYNNIPFDPNHVGVYIGEGQGKTIEADGKSVAYHLIEDYFDNLINSKVRIVVLRIKNLTMEELEMGKVAIKSQVGEQYNNAVNFWFGVWGLLRHIPVIGGGLSWLASKIRNPGYKPNSPNCSIATAKMLDAIPRISNVLKNDGIPIENRTPENLFDVLYKSPEIEIAEDTYLM